MGGGRTHVLHILTAQRLDGADLLLCKVLELLLLLALLFHQLLHTRVQTGVRQPGPRRSEWARKETKEDAGVEGLVCECVCVCECECV